MQSAGPAIIRRSAGGSKVAPRFREASRKRPWWRSQQPRKLHEGFMKPPLNLRNHGGSTKASRTLYDAVAAHPFCGCSGATTVASRSLRGTFVEPSSRSLHKFNKPQKQPQLPKGRFHGESVIPSAKPCVVSIFGLGLGLGFELRLCKKMSTEPPRSHHGSFVEPWCHHGCFAEPSRSHQKFVK